MRRSSRVDRLRAFAGKISSREPQLWIGRSHTRFRQAQLPAHNIRAFDEGHAFVKRDPPRKALATKTAIGADDELLLGDIFQRPADQRGDVFGRFNHCVAMVDHADGDLLVGFDVLEELQILSVGTRQCTRCWFGLPQQVCTQISALTPVN